MGYIMNLPPRYVHLCPPPYGNGEELEVKKPSKVRFEEHANQTFHVEPFSNKDSIWYNEDDYSEFLHNIRYRNDETVIPLNSIQTTSSSNPFLLGQRPLPTWHEVHPLGETIQQKRRLLFQSIMMHQDYCRSRGYIDPDGYAMLSKALSKNDRKHAYQAAAINAYEVECLNNDSSSASSSSSSSTTETASLSVLWMDYYMECIHPFLNKPLVFMSKVLLCDLD